MQSQIEFLFDLQIITSSQFNSMGWDPPRDHQMLSTASSRLLIYLQATDMLS